jgi:hypothetical protein
MPTAEQLAELRHTDPEAWVTAVIAASVAAAPPLPAEVRSRIRALITNAERRAA